LKGGEEVNWSKTGNPPTADVRKNLRNRKEDEMLNKRKLRTIFLIVSLFVFLAFVNTSEAQKPEKGKPILIGVAISITGKQAKAGSFQQKGTQIWEQEVNKRGGLLGRPVKVIFYDDMSDPGTGAKMMEKLITEDKVDLILGPYGSAVSFSVSTIAEKYHYPLLLQTASSEGIFARGYKYTFQIAPPIRSYYIGLFDIAKAKGLRSAAVIWADSLFEKEVSQKVMELSKANNIQVVFQDEFPKASKDFTSTLLKVKGVSPDIFFAGASLPDSVLLVRQMKEIDLAPKIVAMTWGPTIPDFYEALGKDADGVISDSWWEPIFPDPESKKFVKEYRAAFKEDPQIHAGSGYCGGLVIEAAVKKARSLDREKIREALSTMEMKDTYPGVYKVDKTGLQIGHYNSIIQWQDGKRQIIWPKGLATAEIRYPFKPWKER
jgi:branched-chain amino acid transport system substrate-binding protein